jgi:pimeloyl-ACP methyl ester carboxylesterase
MGGSSRPDNFDKSGSPQKCINYFLDYMTKWRIAMGNLSGFYIAGHSFGGFIVGNYALRYKQHIKRVLLISPIGIKEIPEYEHTDYEEYKRICNVI